MKQTGPWTK